MQLTKHWAAVLDDYVIDLAWSDDNELLAAASASGPLSLYGAADGVKRHSLPGHDEGTNCVAWASTTLLASGGQDGKVKLWDAIAGQHTGTAELGQAWVEHLAARPAVQTSKQRSEVRRQKSGETSPEAALEGSDVRALTSDLCLAAAAGRQLCLINLDGTVRHSFKPAPKTISALAWQPAGGCFAVAYFGGVCLWDADDFIAQKEYPYDNGIHALVWSPDNKWLVSGNQDPSVHLWIPETDAELHMSGYEGKVKELSFDQTSRWLATGGGKDACVWDCTGDGPEGREPVMLPHDTKVCAVAFQRAHGLLATASQDGAVMLWSPERRQPLRATIRMPNAATKLVWSPDDRYLAIGSEQGAVYVLKCEA